MNILRRILQAIGSRTFTMTKVYPSASLYSKKTDQMASLKASKYLQLSLSNLALLVFVEKEGILYRQLFSNLEGIIRTEIEVIDCIKTKLRTRSNEDIL